MKTDINIMRKYTMQKELKNYIYITMCYHPRLFHTTKIKSFIITCFETILCKKKTSSLWVSRSNESTVTSHIAQYTVLFWNWLTQSSKIKGEFSYEQWSVFLKRKPDVIRKTYHREIEPFIMHLFGNNVRICKLEKWIHRPN